MIRKITYVIIAVAFMLLFAAPSEAAEEIKIGDYVQLGTYYDNPILWRCVDIDENGPLMLSDRILCLKAFDAPGTNKVGSHARGMINYSISEDAIGAYRQENGSGYWGDSNLRCWLNSTATAGNVDWRCDNPPFSDKLTYNAYADEAGFLNGFTATEQSFIRSVEQKSILNLNEYDTNPSSDLIKHTYKNSINNCVQNYDMAYGEECFDKMFLPSVKQFYSVYENNDVLNGYYIGMPSQAAYDNTSYRTAKFSSEKVWSYWLRDAVSLDDAVVRVFMDGLVGSAAAKGGHIGVRPAFYLNQASLSQLEGSGTTEAPYAPKATPLKISILKRNDSVDVTVTNTQAAVTGRLYVAVYASDGRLTKLHSQSYTGNNGTDTVSIPFSDVNNTIRVYFWTEAYAPLCASSN